MSDVSFPTGPVNTVITPMMIADCIHEDLQKWVARFPGAHVADRREDRLSPRITIGLECAMDGLMQDHVCFFLPLVDLAFTPTAITIAEATNLRRSIMLEYCDPDMMDRLDRLIGDTLSEATTQLFSRQSAP